jgi:hypothetical protein
VPQDLGYKRLKLKKGDMTAVVWWYKRDFHILTNIHNLPVERSFCDEHGNAIKAYTVEQYNRHMGYVDKGNRMVNTYSISSHTWKWTRKNSSTTWISQLWTATFHFRQKYFS